MGYVLPSLSRFPALTADLPGHDASTAPSQTDNLFPETVLEHDKAN